MVCRTVLFDGARNSAAQTSTYTEADKKVSAGGQTPLHYPGLHVSTSTGASTEKYIGVRRKWGHTAEENR